MNDLLRVFAMGAGVYSLRLLGFVAPVELLPPRGVRALAVLPVALLAALILSSHAGPASGDPARIAAIAAGAVVAWRVRKVWAVIAAGLIVYWCLRMIGVGGT